MISFIQNSYNIQFPINLTQKQKPTKEMATTGTYSVPFCRRIRNCSGERIARHSSSDFWTEFGEDMAKTRPRRKLRGLKAKAPPNRVAETAKELGFAEEGDAKWGLKSEERDECRGNWRLERANVGVGVQSKAREEERGEVRRKEKPMREIKWKINLQRLTMEIWLFGTG